MSAFVVGDKTINCIVAFLCREGTNSNGLTYGSLGRSLKDAGWDLNIPDMPASLGKAMFALNVAGVEARYGEGKAKDFRPLDYQFRPVMPPTAVQAVKSLRCWLYQCCEGQGPEDRLYQLGENLINILCSALVSSSPAYEKAAWG